MKATFKMYSLQLWLILSRFTHLLTLQIKPQTIIVGGVLVIGTLLSYPLKAQELEFTGTTKIKPGMKVSNIKTEDGFKLMLSNYSGGLTRSNLIFACNFQNDFTGSTIFKEISDVSINPNSSRRLDVGLPIAHLKSGHNFIFIGEKDKTPGLILEIELAEDGDTILAVSINDYQNTPSKVMIMLLSLIVLLLLGVIITLVLIWKKKHHRLAHKATNTNAKELIRKGYLETALDTLYDCLKSTNKELETEILFLQSQYKHFQRDKSLGMIDDNSYAIRINNITSRALMLANEAV